jgi:hypothetical protein
MLDSSFFFRPLHWIKNSFVIPKNLNSYLNRGVNPINELNSLFHYYDAGVYAFTNTVIEDISFYIDKGFNNIHIGTCKKWVKCM